jgi:PKD repeat protein
MRYLAVVLLLLLIVPVTADNTYTPGIQRYVVGDVLTISTNETVVVAGVQTGGATPIYTTYNVVNRDGRWEIPKYWHGNFQVDEQNLVVNLHAYRVAHADPVLVVITDPTITGGDMQYTGLSLAEVLAGTVYPVEPAPGEPGAGTPLYVTGDILNNTYAPAGGTLIGREYTDNSQIYYRTYDVVKNGDRWEIDSFDYNGFGLPEETLISMGMRRLAHADPHTIIVNDTITNTGDTGWYHLSFAEFLAREGYEPELWDSPPSQSDQPRYLVGDVLGTDASNTTGEVVARVQWTEGSFPIYTTYDVVKNGDRWEIKKYYNGDLQIDAMNVFSMGWHRIDHRDPHFVIVTDLMITPNDLIYGGLSLGEILGGTPGYPFEGVSPTPYKALTIPGRIEAEDYNLGGEGIAFHDTTPGNAGGAYRQDDVDIEANPTEGTPDIGWIRDGEWLTYTVNVTQAGSYTLTARVASPNNDRTVVLSIDGVQFPTITIPNTGSFATFTNVTPFMYVDLPPQTPTPGPTGSTVPIPVTLTAGMHVLNLTFSGDGQNINWIEFTKSTVPIGIVPGGTGVPRDLNGDGMYEDVNGNGVLDFNDVVLFFNQMDWIAANEPVAAFDFAGDGKIDFNDVVMLFTSL